MELYILKVCEVISLSAVLCNIIMACFCFVDLQLGPQEIYGLKWHFSSVHNHHIFVKNYVPIFLTQCELCQVDEGFLICNQSEIL